MTARIFVASRNAKKIAEMERILAPLVPGVRVLGLDDVDFYEEPVEDAPTFEGNALLKARAGFAATGLPSVSDDSGLCVDALNGMPGVLSARWGGRPKSDQRNNELLLDQLNDVPDERRGAHFACAIAFVFGDGPDGEIVVEGRMDGRVIRELRGEGGFGYDVMFVADDTPDGRTSAELTVAEKDAISHRGKAMRELGPRIAKVLG
ncbi:RdgB/HAM1 family non-canonical purine NTP pyrophosphatase [Nocardioides nematodiphilus]|uniref:RdgB/HAM1 family non-canonical purine NTP pyrophosphatase n=1 Tax=Nocardioides nematodiphilus TaxID=2849669 RepID=UPI001CD9D201|nr:RdgB/HAM1 family non-canonical purine NTP pyrophosphatase [Nocardioides nematodiphilus]MCA1984155.1 RdgB/HAM1 family non-canonical purine NTP pyrophosphatase [Nocardioides nematodiphilus]